MASKQLSVDNTEEVVIDVKIRPKRGRILGSLKDLLPKFSNENSEGREFGGQEYDQAYATITVGGRERTVSLYGPSRGTGLIDLDGEVQKIGGHPAPEHFYRIVDGMIEGAVKEMGFE